MRSKNQIYLPILVAVILLLIIASGFVDVSLLNRENEYLGVILLEIVIFALPCIIFSRIFSQKPVNTLKISVFKADKVFFILLAAVLLISGSLLYGFLFDGDSASDMSFTLYRIFTAKKTSSFSGVLYLVLAYALIPSVFEEFTFRGVVCSGYEEASPIYSIAMSSVFFAMIHFDLRMFPFHLIAGAVLGIVVYATGSVFASIAVHMAFNLFFIFANDYSLAFVSADGSFSFFVIGTLFLLCAALFCAEGRKIYRKKARTTPIDDKPKGKRINPLEIVLSPSAVVCYLIFFAVVFLK